MELGELKQLLMESWLLETCSPGLRDKWHEENPSLGQCAITSLIVNDFFGGKIMRCMASTGSHYYNIIDDEIIDLTKEQFLGEIPDYEKGEERTREYLLSNKDTNNRYLLLNKILRENIKAKEKIRENRYQMCVKQRKEHNNANDTLNYYNENALEYCEQTKNGNMKEAYNHFLVLLPDNAYILDFGCGSGRDSKYFKEKGYKVRAIDGSEKLCELASKYIGQKVECMRFDELSEELIYDGIWACASLLHVEREKLPDILRKMIKALKEDGVIYASFKLGNQEIIEDGKYYNYLTKEILEDILKQIEPNPEIIDYYESGIYQKIDRPKSTWGSYLIKKKKI